MGDGMSASSPDGEGTVVLRIATRISVAATSSLPSAVAAEPTLQELWATSNILLRRNEDGAFAWALWNKPGCCLCMVKMFAVTLRRAETAQQEELRKAFLFLAIQTCKSFFNIAEVAPEPDCNRSSSYARAATAIVRSGVLHCLSRLSATATRFNSLNMQKKAIIKSGQHRMDANTEVSADVLQGMRLLTSIRLINKLILRSKAMETAVDDTCTNHGTADGRKGFAFELCTALAESRLVEHVVREMSLSHNSAGTAEYIRVLLYNMTGLLRLQPLLPCKYHLIGPNLQFIATVIAIDVLQSCDGGGSWYGLPQNIVVNLRLNVLGPANNGSLSCVPQPCLDILLNWLELMAPTRSGQPRATGCCILSAAALYEICMRISACCLDAASTSVTVLSKDGDNVAAGGRNGSNSSDLSSLSVGHCALCCEISIRAMLGAKDVMERRHARPRPCLPGIAAPSDHGGAAPPMPPPTPPRGNSRGSLPATPHPIAASAASIAASPAGSQAAVGWASTQHMRPQHVRLRWWTQAAKAMDLAALLLSERPAGGGESWPSVLVGALFADGDLGQELPALLPAEPPAGVTAALQSGVLPSLEHLLRRTFSLRTGGTKLGEFPEDVNIAAATISWPQLGWLLAYCNPRQAAAFVVTLGKVLRCCLGMRNSAEGLISQQMADGNRDMLVLCSIRWVRNARGWATRRFLESSNRRAEGSARQLLTVHTLAYRTWLPIWASYASCRMRRYSDPRLTRHESSATVAAAAGSSTNPGAGADAGGSNHEDDSSDIVGPTLTMLKPALEQLNRLMATRRWKMENVKTGTIKNDDGGQHSYGSGEGGWGPRQLQQQGGHPSYRSLSAGTEAATTDGVCRDIGAWKLLLVDEVNVLDLKRLVAEKVDILLSDTVASYLPVLQQCEEILVRDDPPMIDSTPSPVLDRCHIVGAAATLQLEAREGATSREGKAYEPYRRRKELVVLAILTNVVLVACALRAGMVATVMFALILAAFRTAMEHQLQVAVKGAPQSNLSSHGSGRRGTHTGALMGVLRPQFNFLAAVFTWRPHQASLPLAPAEAAASCWLHQSQEPVLKLPPSPSPPPPPPGEFDMVFLEEARSHLISCGFAGCLNLSGRSETDLEHLLQQMRAPARAQEPQGAAAENAVRCCSTECYEGMKKGLREGNKGGSS